MQGGYEVRILNKRLAIIGLENNAFVQSVFQKHQDSSGFTIVAYVDPKLDGNHPMQIDGSIPVISLDELKMRYPHSIDGVFIVTKQVCNAEYLSLELYDAGIKDVFVPYPIQMEKKSDFLADARDVEFSPNFVYSPKWDRPFLFRLETHIVDHCNLNCKGCNNFSPLCVKKVASYEQYDSDMERLKSLFDNICIIGLQGGEPLLEPDISLRFAEIARKHFPQSDIRLLTNGLLIPKCNDDFFIALREQNVTVHISVYEPTERILDEAKSKMDNNGTNYYIVGKRNKFGKYITEFPFEDAMYNARNCVSIGCHYLDSGRLFKCPEEALVENLDIHYGTQIYSPNSGIDIYSENDPWRILRVLCSACYLCSFCTRQRQEYFDWSNEKDLSLSDWVVPHRYEYEKTKDSNEINTLKSKTNMLENRILEAVRDNIKNMETIRQTEDKVIRLEHTLKQQEEMLKKSEKKESEYSLMIESYNCQLELASTQILELEHRKRTQDSQIVELQNNVITAQNIYENVISSTTWKLTKPMRKALDWVKLLFRVRK